MESGGLVLQEYRRKRLKKRQQQRKLFVILGFLVILASIAGFYIHYQEKKTADAGKFIHQGTSTYYEVGSKKIKAKGLQKIQGNDYYFDSTTGIMQTGFQMVNGKQYYFDATGKRAEGLRQVNGYYYYFTANGTDDVLKAYGAVAQSANSGNSVIEQTIKAGLKLVGNSPYVYGGGRTDASVAKNQYDCSSFVAEMYRLGGKSLVYQYAASTTLLAETGTLVAWGNKSRGDLLVTAADATEDEQHVAIYLGDGFILHDSTSTKGVAVSRLNQVINKKVLGNMTWADLFEQGTVRREV